MKRFQIAFRAVGSVTPCPVIFITALPKNIIPEIRAPRITPVAYLNYILTPILNANLSSSLSLKIVFNSFRIGIPTAL